MSSSSSSTTGRRAPPGYVVDEIHIKVGHAGLKPLSSALNFLLKVGKDLVVEVEADAMTLRSLNDPKSAFASITFPVSFFDEYTLRVVPPKPAMSFKLALRPICAIMKNFRKVRSLVIRTDPNAQPAQGDDLQLFFEMDSEMGIRRIHKFTYMDSEVINAAFDEGSASSLRVQARNFTTYLQHIHQHSVEVQMDAAPDAFRVKSYHKVTVQDPLAAGGQAGQPRHMTTEMSIDLTEFEHYDYRAEEREVMLIFCLKELKGLLTLCDQTDVMDMELFFVESGAPVKVRCDLPGCFSVSLVMATLMAASLNADSMSQEEDQDARLSQLPPPPPPELQPDEDDAAASASAPFAGFTAATGVPMSQASASSASSATSMSQGVVGPRRKATRPRSGVRRITEDDDDEDDDE